MPIIVISARQQESDKVDALDAGARRLRHQALRSPRAARARPRPLFATPKEPDLRNESLVVVLRAS